MPKNVKYITLVGGITLLSLSSLKYFDTELDYSESFGYFAQRLNGIHHPLWYIFLTSSAVIAGIGFLQLHKALFYSSLLLLSFPIGYYSYILISRFLEVRNASTPTGFYLSICGFCIVTLASIISLHGPKIKIESDLLDS